jgi:zinc transport system substrate-binding protein
VCAAAVLTASVAAGAVESQPSVVVTTSMLEQAVLELGEAADGVELVRLLPPSSCPGHFDVSPQAVPALRSADAIIRHEYQAVLESKLEEMGVSGATVVVADADGSLLIPDHYGELVARVAEILAELDPPRSQQLATATASVRARMAELQSETRARPAPWHGAPVIASFQQAGFSRWLGLAVLAEIGRPEDTSPRDLERLLRLRPALVVGSLQEGLQSAATVAERLQVPLVVFSNFPGVDGYGDGYRQLLDGNLLRLDEAWSSR